MQRTRHELAENTPDRLWRKARWGRAMIVGDALGDTASSDRRVVQTRVACRAREILSVRPILIEQLENKDMMTSRRHRCQDDRAVDRGFSGRKMMKNPVLELPLAEVMRPEIALILQQVLHVHTVGSFLRTWRSARGQKSLEQFFDNPQQARHAAAICAAWLGMKIPATHGLASGAWWVDEQPMHPMSV